MCRAATSDEEGKVWSLPKVWVSIRSYKKQAVKKWIKKTLGRTLDLAWFKFTMVALMWVYLRYWRITLTLDYFLY